MKFNVISKLAALSMLGIVACGFVGCSSDDDSDQPKIIVKELSLVDPTQAALMFDAPKSQQTLKIKTDAPVSAIAVEQLASEDKATWCIVKVKSATEITVDVSANTLTTARKATYKVKAGDITPIEFTVTQGFPEPTQTVMSIDLKPDEWDIYTFNAAAVSPQNFEVQVTTNSNTWTAVADFFGDPYFEVVTGTGRSGDKAVVRFIGTNAGQNMGGTLKISSGNAEPIDININQDQPAATSMKVSTEEDWAFETPFKTNHVVTFAATDAGSKNKQKFGVQANGSFTSKICNAGTSVEATNPWLDAAAGISGINIATKSENTGAARSLDFVILGGTTELFRFKVTQSAKL